VNAGSHAAILATGQRFVGHGIRAIEPALWELIASARSELHMAVYRFDLEAAPIVDLVERALQSGVSLLLVAHDLRRQPSRICSRIEEFRLNYRHAQVVDFAESAGGFLHAKVVVADRTRAIVGSANLTVGGLGTNHEIAVLIEGEPAWQIASLIDLLATGEGSRS
jgi:phosphatidylserine/phosphatidylglycerophosphate/cardiolipin synthase-like enzyme